MGMVEELTQLAEDNRKELAQFRKEVRTAFQTIRHDHQKAVEVNKNLVEQQEQEVYEKSEHAKHDEFEAASQRKIGPGREEPETDEPHTRPAPHNDATTRTITSQHQDEEEDSEPYRRPERWHDQSHDEEAPPRPSSHRDWGRSTRRIGNYNNEDD